MRVFASHKIKHILAATVVAGIALHGSAFGGPISTYTQIDLKEPFPQFGFGLAIVSQPMIEGVVIESRIDITFTTAAGFDAAAFTMLLLAPTAQPPPFGGFESHWSVTGADLGWSGQGTFVASVSSIALAGLIGPDPAFAIWELELGPNFGTIEALLIEHDYVAVPAPAAMALFSLAFVAVRRRKREVTQEHAANAVRGLNGIKEE